MVTRVSDQVEWVKNLISETEPGISDFEFEPIQKVILMSGSEIPTSRVLLQESIASATKCKSDLYYLSLKLKELKAKASVKYNVEFNKKFTLLTRQGRPSRQAIESEIFHTSPEMAITNEKLQKYDMILDYIEGLMDVVNLMIRNYDRRHYEMQI